MQLLQHQPDVVARAAQHGMQRITERTLERASSQPALHLHRADGRLDRAPSPDHRKHPANTP